MSYLLTKYMRPEKVGFVRANQSREYACIDCVRQIVEDVRFVYNYHLQIHQGTHTKPKIANLNVVFVKTENGRQAHAYVAGWPALIVEYP